MAPVAAVVVVPGLEVVVGAGGPVFAVGNVAAGEEGLVDTGPLRNVVLAGAGARPWGATLVVGDLDVTPATAG